MLTLAAAALWFILPRRTNAQAAQDGSGKWDRSARGVTFVAVAGGLVLIGHFAAFTYVTSLVTGIGNLDSGAIPVVLLILGGTGAVGIAVSGFASDRFPRSAIIVTAALIAGGLILLALGDGRPAIFLTGIVVWGFAIGAFPPVLQTRVLRLSSASFRPLAGSIVITVLNLGTAAGATLGGIALGSGQILLTLAALIAAGAGTLVLLLAPVGAHPADG